MLDFQELIIRFQLLKQEISATETFVCSHVSDHSGFHYRQQLLWLLQKQLSREDYHEFVTHEGDMTLDLIDRYSGHEALWYHRLDLNSAYSELADIIPAFSTAKAQESCKYFICTNELLNYTLREHYDF